MAKQLKIAVLGAGPAGLGAALYLHRSKKAQATVFEAAERVGGAASSFEIAGIKCDLGSHRLHPAAEDFILNDIKAILGEDLLWRPRHGRIRLQGKWIHFPLKPADFALNAPKPFVASVALDSLAKILPKKPVREETFATVLAAGLGRTICQSFYFPYARKLWGAEPEELDATAARRRVSASSLPKMLMKVARQLPFLKSPTTGGFYYPREGFGQICEGLKRESESLGATYRLNARVTQLTPRAEGGYTLTSEDRTGHVEAEDYDQVWSTLPISVLSKLMGPVTPTEVLSAASAMRSRAMILIYLVLNTDQFTEYDANYFPETEIGLSRLSEPKNYSAKGVPAGRTVLCGELPCAVGDSFWKMSDEGLSQKMCDWLATAGLPVKAEVISVETRRLSHAYPIYDKGYGAHFDRLESWVLAQPNLVSFGRQGLFAHDNTHHALAMAHGAVGCLSETGTFDHEQWAKAREGFKTHVVED